MAIALVAAFWGALGSVIVPLAIRVLVGVGFASVTYSGISIVWDNIKANLVAQLGSLSGSIVTILAMARVDDAIAVVISAMSAKLVLKGLTAAGAFSQMRFKGGG